MSHFAGRQRKIGVARKKFRHAGPRLRNGSRFSALDLNVVYVTGVKPSHAFARDTRRSQWAVANSSFLAYTAYPFPCGFYLSYEWFQRRRNKSAMSRVACA